MLRVPPMVLYSFISTPAAVIQSNHIGDIGVLLLPAMNIQCVSHIVLQDADRVITSVPCTHDVLEHDSSNLLHHSDDHSNVVTLTTPTLDVAHTSIRVAARDTTDSDIP